MCTSYHSLTCQVLSEHLPSLLTTYHTTLDSTLTSLHYPKEIPNLEQVREGTYSLGMMAMPAVMALINLEPEATKELMDARLEDTYDITITTLTITTITITNFIPFLTINFTSYSITITSLITTMLDTIRAPDPP